MKLSGSYFRRVKEIKVAEEVMESGQKLSQEQARKLISHFKQQRYDTDKIIHEMAAYGLYDFQVIELMNE